MKKLISYDPVTGSCHWKYRQNVSKTWNKRFSGKQLGTKDSKGYLVTKISGKSYKVHRLIWLYMTGKWPDNEIDHIDRIKDNNSWENLRDVKTQQNCMNRGINSKNKTGFVGVYFNEKLDRFVAQLKHSGINYHLGCFKNIEEAVTAREKAEKKLGYIK